MPHPTQSVFAISLFNAASAIGGGIALVTGLLPVPTSLLRHTPFDTYVLPGLFLAVVIGGSSLAAAITVIGRARRARAISGAAGLTMVGWIVGETIIVQGFSWLQALYLLSGLLAALGSWYPPVSAPGTPSGAAPYAGPPPPGSSSGAAKASGQEPTRDPSAMLRC